MNSMSALFWSYLFLFWLSRKVTDRGTHFENYTCCFLSFFHLSPTHTVQCSLRSICKPQEQAPFLRWNASRCEQIHQCSSPTEIRRWWMDLMDWFKTQLPVLAHCITEWMREQITSAGGECIYTVHFLNSSSGSVHPSLWLIVMLGFLKVILYALLFLNKEVVWHQHY